MGYTTRFTGELKFDPELTASQIVKLESMFQEDCRKHPDWDGGKGLYYIDLEFNDDYSGMRWCAAEKTYDMEKLVNVVILEMRKKWPSFGVTGSLSACGEDIDDRWTLYIDEKDGLAHKAKVLIVGTKVQCPECEHEFYIKEK